MTMNWKSSQFLYYVGVSIDENFVASQYMKYCLFELGRKTQI